MKDAAEYFGRGGCKNPSEAMLVFCKRHGIPLEPIGARMWGVRKVSLDEASKRFKRARKLAMKRSA